MNRTSWLRLERWYLSLNIIQRWLVNIGVALFVVCCIIVVTHEPSERKRVTKIVLNCDHCGTDPERAISYNEYIDRKEQTQKTQFLAAKQQIQQDAWNENGRRRWCRERPQDKNCQ